MRKVEQRGIPLERATPSGSPFWLGFRSLYPNAWVIVGFSRVAFNLERTEALVYSNHQCGPDCYNSDTWYLRRVGASWGIVERIPTGTSNNWQATFSPLRYLGLDAGRYAYRRRRALVTFTNAVTERRLTSLPVNTHRNTGDSRIWVTDSAGRVDFGRLRLTGVILMKVACPDQSHPDSIFADAFIVSPGRDTAFSVRLDFRQCFRPRPGETVQRTLSGAQAFISETEARFVFPLRGPTYIRDLPLKGAHAGSPEHMWDVSWDIPAGKDGIDPISLWWARDWTPGGPRKGSLAELIAGQLLEPMINCTTCDMAVFSDPRKDPKNVYATVERGRLVFRVRGREAVRRIFPTPPMTVTFSTRARQVAMREYGPGDIEETQTVIVNCRSSDSSAALRRRCDASSGDQVQRPPSARRVQVIALSYDGSSLMRNLDVRVRSEDRKVPTVVKSTGGIGKLSTVQTAPDSVTFEALCATKRGSQRKVGGRMSMYIAPGADTTLQLLVDPRACGR